MLTATLRLEDLDAEDPAAGSRAVCCPEACALSGGDVLTLAFLLTQEKEVRAV